MMIRDQSGDGARAGREPGTSLNALSADLLDELPNIDHAFFARNGGVSDGLYAGLNTGLGSRDDKKAVQQNRRLAANHLGVDPNRLATPYQVHGALAVVANEDWTDENKPQADAVVIDRPGFAVGVGTADCGPVLFAEPDAGIVAAAHAGWKGAIGGILDAAIDKIISLGGQRERIVAVLGPTISADNYEVGPEFRRSFEAVDPANDRFFSNVQANGHAYFDLPGYIVARLSGLDIAKASSLGACTYADAEQFYSYRRSTHRGEPDYGRHLSAIVLREDC